MNKKSLIKLTHFVKLYEINSKKEKGRKERILIMNMLSINIEKNLEILIQLRKENPFLTHIMFRRDDGDRKSVV